LIINNLKRIELIEGKEEIAKPSKKDLINKDKRSEDRIFKGTWKLDN
jgi:hypothetical protein